MENLALIQIPAIKPTDRLLDIANVPIIVEENALFVQARELRDTLIQEAEKFRFKIRVRQGLQSCHTDFTSASEIQKVCR